MLSEQSHFATPLEKLTVASLKVTFSSLRGFLPQGIYWKGKSCISAVLEILKLPPG